MLARELAGPKGRVAVIDTENGTAEKYAGIVADFDHASLTDHAPKRYIEAIRCAEAEGYDVVVVDSLSHAWVGKGGALEQVDNAAKRSGGNSFGAWRDITPQHNALVDALTGCRAHVIVTMRSKMAYEVTKDDKGKTTVTKLGLAPVQREGLEYEMDLVADMTIDNDLCVTKSRCPELAGATVRHPGPDVAAKLKAWLNDGAPAPAAAPARTVAEQLVALLDGVVDAPELAKASEAGKRAWAKLTKAEQATVTAAVKRAKERVDEHEEASAARASTEDHGADAPDSDPDPNNGAETAGDADPGAEAA